MKIILNNEYSINQIDIGYALVNTHMTRGNAKNKSNKPRLIETTVAYSMTVEHAIEIFVRRFLDKKTSDFEGDLNEYIKRIENIKKSCVEEVLKGVEKVL